MRLLFRLLRLFFVILPVTGLIYSACFVVLTVSMFKDVSILSMIPMSFDSDAVRTAILGVAKNYLGLMAKYGGTLMYFVLILIFLILVVPMACLLIAVATFAAFGKTLIIGLIADAVIYLIGTILTGHSPTAMILSRYAVLFPAMGHRINEKKYNKLLKQRSRELERMNNTDIFYDRRDAYQYPEEDLDENCEDYYESQDDFEDVQDDYYDARQEYEAEYDDEDYDDSEYYEEEYTNNRRRTRQQDSAPQTAAESFNFFAGCRTRESADRKYKQLVKLYHPDNMDGDTSALQEINVQYDRIKKELNA